MEKLQARIAAGKAELDRLRPMSEAVYRHLQKYYDVELTYTSNAIEGNTLTLRETAEVIEHGIFMHERLDATLAEYLSALHETLPISGTAALIPEGGARAP